VRAISRLIDDEALPPQEAIGVFRAFFAMDVDNLGIARVELPDLKAQARPQPPR
jgi:hypothetical protein